MAGLVPSPAGTPEGQVPAAATEPWRQEGLVQRGWAEGSLLVGGGTHNQGWPRPLAPPPPPFDMRMATELRGAFVDPGLLARASHKRLGGKRTNGALSRRQLSLSVRLCPKYVTFLRSTHQPYDMHECMLSLSIILILCDPMDCSPPGSSIHEILQARILEWVASCCSTPRAPAASRRFLVRPGPECPVMWP